MNIPDEASYLGLLGFKTRRQDISASVPFNIWEQWMKDTNGAIEKDSKLLARYLNDPDNKYFKVAPTNI